MDFHSIKRYNINADTVAASVAGALKAETLVSMTDVVGLLRDKNDESTLIHKVFISDVPALIADGVIGGGMIPKIDSMTNALREGVKKEQLCKLGTGGGVVKV